MSISYGNHAHGYELSSVYPNPFNPSTTINFTVTDNIDLSLVIYDMKGRVVETLINGSVNPGVYNVNWNAKDIASGIYFARLSSASNEQIQKLMLVK